jgi:hypothetical protein
MIIAQISNTHIALGARDAGRRIRDFERTIADINARDPAPDPRPYRGMKKDPVLNECRAKSDNVRPALLVRP